MAKLSDLIIQHPDVDSFAKLKHLVAHAGESGQMFLEFDVKPDYRDTPKKWEWQLEAIFARGLKYDQ
ncbi:MAG: sulfur relay protein DsrC [Marinosulfonomonas sp.]|nr:MAG: sulfur relay protein DsrC [Marinosulfonomonas sp.]